MSKAQQITIDQIDEQPEAPSLSARAIQSLKSMATFSEVLRFSGAAIVVASMSSFILQDWGSANDIQHYFMLLMQSALLAGGGFAMSYLLKENKGARIFFGLGLISVTANFTILGALIYSLLPLDLSLAHYPGYAHWVATSPKMLALTIGVALLVMFPITRFGMMVMSRPAAGRLSIVFLLMNSLLLLPVRSTTYVGIIALASLIGLSLVISRYLKSENHLRTPGGIFAQGLLYLPLGVMLGRAVFLYTPDAILALSISLMIYLGLRTLSQRLSANHIIKAVADTLAYITSFSIAISMASIAVLFVADVFWLPVFAVMLLATSYELLGRISSAGLKRVFHWLTGCVFALSFALNMLMFDSFSASMIGLLAGGTMAMYAWKRGERTFMLFSTALIFLAARYQLEGLIDFLFNHSWVSLAVMGSSAIVLASVIDRHGAALKLKMEHWLDKAKQKA